MKIAQLVSSANAVSPIATKAIYSHVGSLCNGLISRGHDVALYGASDSNTNAKLISVAPHSLVDSLNISERQRNYYLKLLISKCYQSASKYDIIHSHFTLLSSFYQKLVKTPTVLSVHSPIPDDIKPFLHEFKHIPYLSFSLAQRKQMPELNWYANIYHGVDLKKFAYNPEPQDYFLYLGRVTDDKGTHLAIEAAKKTGVQLVIAGKSYPQEGYWHSQIEDYIDGVSIRYIGEQGLEEKITWLQNAKALLFPTQVDEIFGYVMIEAMACGTPVIGWNNGAVPEVIQEYKTGYIVNSVSEMASAIENIDKISRQETHKRAEMYFSIKKMVSGYEKVYQRLLGDISFKKAKKK